MDKIKEGFILWLRLIVIAWFVWMQHSALAIYESGMIVWDIIPGDIFGWGVSIVGFLLAGRLLWLLK